MTKPLERILLMSVRPNFADMIVSGDKTAELRRTSVRVGRGAIGLVYASSPRRALIGAVRVASVEVGAPSTTWRKWSKRLGLSKAEFDEYTTGCNQLNTILIDEARSFPTPIPLHGLRSRWQNFVAPQSFRYPATDEFGALLNGERSIVDELERGSLR